MSGYNTVDEAVIEASPEVLWEALVAEFRGARRWYVPYVTFRPGATPLDRIGGETHVTVHTRGLDRPGLRLRYTSRSRVVEPDRHLAVEYVSGAFRGEEEFVLQPLEGGGTRLAIHWRARPHGWVRFLARLVHLDEEHSRVTREALANLATLAQLTADQAQDEPQPVP